MIPFIFSIVNLLYMIIVSIIYFSKKKIRNIESEIYTGLLVVTLVGIFIDIFPYDILPENKDEMLNFVRLEKYILNFMKFRVNLIDKFDTFKKQQSWHSSNFPYNIYHFKKNRCSNAESLFKRVAWFSLSASLKKSHIKYIIKVLKDYQNGI